MPLNLRDDSAGATAGIEIMRGSWTGIPEYSLRIIHHGTMQFAAFHANFKDR